MSASQAISDYFRKLGGLIENFNFTRKGHEESLGKEAAGKVAEGIITRSIDKQGGPDGAWPANTVEYTDMKKALYGVELIGVRTGQMFSMMAMLGKVDVSPHEVLIHYGTNKPPSNTPHPIYDVDLRVTDTDKAKYFTDLKGAFFKLDTVIADEVIEYFAEELDKFIRELNVR